MLLLFLFGASSALLVEYQTIDFFGNTVKLEDLDRAERIIRISVINATILPTGSITDFEDLKILQLQRNGLKEIQPGSLKNLPSLEIFRGQENNLKKISNGVFSNLPLIFLNLDHNQIEEVSKQAFYNLTQLQVLDLSYNKLKVFYGEWLMEKPNLKLVNFAFNLIEGLPDLALDGYHSDVDFGNNRIKNLSRGIFGVKNGSFLGEVRFSENEIEVWREDLLDGVKLQGFDVSRNRIRCLDGDFGRFFRARRSRIGGNPWRCECLEKIRNWRKMNNVSVNLSPETCVEN